MWINVADIFEQLEINISWIDFKFGLKIIMLLSIWMKSWISWILSSFTVNIKCRLSVRLLRSPCAPTYSPVYFCGIHSRIVLKTSSYGFLTIHTALRSGLLPSSTHHSCCVRKFYTWVVGPTVFMAYLCTLILFAKNLLRFYIFFFIFRFDTWSEIRIRALRLISQRTAY